MLIYAHRGASADYREMSRAAYLAAVEQGADGFECDLRLTKDRVLICWHDDDLLRIAQSPLTVAGSTLSELQAVTEILTFEELLDIALSHRKNLALETKHPVPTGGAVEVALINALSENSVRIKASGIDIAIMSFSWWAIRRVRRSGILGIYLIAHRWQRIFNFFGGIGPGIFLLREDQDLARKLTRRNRKLFIWTVNTPEDLKVAKEARADVVMTDMPGKMREYLSTL
jgi:glycerophosphoryl diester phosphodiesterase